MAFFHEPRGRQPFLRAPASVITLVVLLLFSYLAFSLASAATQADLTAEFAFWPARYSQAFMSANHYNPGSILDRAIPFISYNFLHGSWTHVGFNAIWLLAFGPPVAQRLGPVWFYLFFFFCSAIGAASFLALDWGSTAFAIGASGGISGLMGAVFRLIAAPTPFGAMAPKLAPLFSQRVLIWSALWIAMNLLAGLTTLGTPGDGVQMIAWQIHIGSYLSGLLLISLFDRLAERRIVPSGTG